MHLLQYLPDFKGIETWLAYSFVKLLILQYLPDFKGIETPLAGEVARIFAYSTSLTSKGLRRFQGKCQQLRYTCSTSLTSKGLRHFIALARAILSSCSTSLTSKGLRQARRGDLVLYCLAVPPWLQRDWDIASAYCPFSCVLAVPPWLQRDWDNLCFVVRNHLILQYLPDFKGIETPLAMKQHLLLPCSTSLTSKGLRRLWVNTKQTIGLAVPPWLQRDTFKNWPVNTYRPVLFVYAVCVSR